MFSAMPEYSEAGCDYDLGSESLGFSTSFNPAFRVRSILWNGQKLMAMDPPPLKGSRVERGEFLPQISSVR